MARLHFPCLLLMVSVISAVRDVQDAKQKYEEAMVHSSASHLVDPSKVVKLSQKTRAYTYKGLVSKKECDHLISLGHRKQERLMVENQGENDKSSSIVMYQDEIVSGIEERIAAWTLLPKENGEPLQISHYAKNETYQHHSDYIKDEYIVATRGQRLATVLIYLSTVNMGGETYFLDHELEKSITNNSSEAVCGSSSHLVKPAMGDALLLFTLHPNMSEDKRNVYGSCPILEGEQWLATKYIHTKPFSDSQISLKVAADDCTDEEDNCFAWAASGECKRNPVYMIGTIDYQGSCRKSCKVC